MATSGRVESGTNNGSRFYFQWQYTGQNIGGNYSTINWQWGLNISPGGYYWSTNAVKSVSGYINGGQAFGGATWSNISGTGDHQLLAGSWTIGHNADGNKNFGISSTGWLYSYGNMGNSGSWDLPWIPRHATLTGLSMDAGGIPATDEGPYWVEFSNPAGTGVDAFIEAAPSYSRVYTSGAVGSRYNFPWTTAMAQDLQARTPNSNTNTIRIGIHDSLGGDNWDYRDRTYTIKNDVGQANPLFTDFTFQDTNATTAAITGNNQVLIQGKSTLDVTVPVASKATPQKFATMSSYTTSLGSFSDSSTWSNTADVTKTVGVVSDVTGSQNISVRAIDSRGNSKTVTKPVTILPYFSPGFFYAVDVKYTNEFDNSTGLTAAGYDANAIAIVAPMTLAGVDKNVVNSTSGLRWQLSKGDAPWSGVWHNIASTQEATTGYIRVNTATLATAINNEMNTQGADNTVPWYVWFQVTDSLNEPQDYVIVIDVGRPIMRIGADGYLYHKEQEFSSAFNPTSHVFMPAAVAIPGAGGGTWGYETITGTPPAATGTVAFTNSATKSNGTYFIFETFLSPGVYTMYLWAVRAVDAPLIAVYQDGSNIFQATSGGAWDLYSATTSVGYRPSLSGIPIDTPGVYQFAIQANGKNALSTGYYLRVFGAYFYKTGYYA